MRGRVEVQSRARRSYSAVVMPTEALFALGILKLTSLIVMAIVDERLRYHGGGDEGPNRCDESL